MAGTSSFLLTTMQAPDAISAPMAGSHLQLIQRRSVKPALWTTCTFKTASETLTAGLLKRFLLFLLSTVRVFRGVSHKDQLACNDMYNRNANAPPAAGNPTTLDP